MNRAVLAGSNKLRGGPGKDSYLDKLVKFVPVEGLAPAVVLANSVSDNDALLWATWALALLVGLALTVAQTVDTNPAPRVWFWPFVVVAFAAWSLGAVDQFRQLVDIPTKTGQWALGASAFALPALDTALEKVFRKS